MIQDACNNESSGDLKSPVRFRPLQKTVRGSGAHDAREGTCPSNADQWLETGIADTVSILAQPLADAARGRNTIRKQPNADDTLE